MSSASHTAASVASSSHHTISTSATPLSTSSRFSIYQAFEALTHHDIDFFNRLVASLPPHAADFSQLKSTYAALLPKELDQRRRDGSNARGASPHDSDAYLWSILLSLVKVRGRNWRERWDSVRLALGLDPNSGDETDISAATQSTDLDVNSNLVQHTARSRPQQLWDQPHHHPGRRASGSNRLISNLTPRRTRVNDADRPHRDHLRLPRASSPLSRPRESQLSGEERQQPEAESRQTRSHVDDSISAIQVRLDRLLNSDASPGDESSEADSPDVAPAAELFSSVARLSADAKRRFDELVRSSQSERSRIRRSNTESQNRDGDDRLVNQLETAEQWRQRRILQHSLAWWIALTRQRLEQMRNAADAGDRVILDKTWQHWQLQMQHELECRRTGRKTDRVRCALTAFRRWKRLAQTAVERRKELKTGSMRTAFYTTASAVNTRIIDQALHAWRNKRRIRISDRVRRHHLQAGAFALWQMKSSHIKKLHTRGKIMAIKRNHSILTQAWDRWADRYEENKTLVQFSQHHNGVLARKAFDTWRQKAVLSRLSLAFTERRLKLSTLDVWKQSLEQRRLRQRYEAIAARWRARRLKQSAIKFWHHRRQKITNMEGQATKMRQDGTKEKVYDVFHRWQLQSRAALLDRVRTAGMLERTLHQWKHRYTALTVSLQQRESSMTQRRNRTLYRTYLNRWRKATCELRTQEAAVVARSDESLCRDYLIAWCNKLLEHHLLQQRSAAVSDYFILRSSFQRWRLQLREHRADIKETEHNHRLVHQVFTIWKTRSEKQQHLATLLQHSLAKRNETLAQHHLGRWVASIIQVRERELEVKEQRERRLVRAAFFAWIEACLRQDELLALMYRFIDIKEIERKERSFQHWHTAACEQKKRREKVNVFETFAQKTLLARALSIWQDRMRDCALATQEYDMLIRRHQLCLQWALNLWQSQTLMLPAIRMRNANLRRAALQYWRKKLPVAQIANQGAKLYRVRTLQCTWQAWTEKCKIKRQLRAAARFGAGSISMQRLRTLSAAAAANRSAGSSSPAAVQSSSPFRSLPGSSPSSQFTTPVRRPKTSLALLPHAYSDSPNLDSALGGQISVIGDDVRSGRRTQRGPSFSRRSASVPRHLDVANVSDAARHRESESPSRDAASRRAKAPVAAATPTSASMSDRSRFSLALQSSTSFNSAAYAATAETKRELKRGRKSAALTEDGPTLSSLTSSKILNGYAQSDTESYSVTRTRRSAKYEQTCSAGLTSKTEATVRLEPPDSESANSVQSAPAQPRVAKGPRGSLQSFAVAEEMIGQLRTRSKAHLREQ
ncbi:uncharacterized protein MEPE_04900 [Melanopsichium pennsylvanicum]|uniref:Sfi1 spindle body domain-containing protein n=2 Tax=Melanopsichium pennsylvanicum TaxID=63383 RepID=A0AAJ5C6T1_9BASI|nr:conserved hypothetical protein [Melanopsichium pennsylvanicum 4]SNX86191.1 uncharacterized protein MEPE_04900 [Melanopsichium pennsylvanicum]